MKLILSVAQFVTIMFLTSCASKSAQVNKEPVFIYERTACSGACPVFTAHVYANGLAVLRVEENFLDGQGTYQVKLSEEELSRIEDYFDKASFMSLNKEYTTHLKDLPTTFITYNHLGESKKIKIYGDAPANLELLKDYLYDQIKEAEWKKVNKTGLP